MHYLIFIQGLSPKVSIIVPIYLIGKVSSEWSSDLFKIKHRSSIEEGIQNLKGGSQPSPMLAPHQV